MNDNSSIQILMEGWKPSNVENIPENPVQQNVPTVDACTSDCDDDYDTCSCDCRVDCNKD